MSAELVLSLISVSVTLLLGLLMWSNSRRGTSIDQGDKIAERRRLELERLYIRVDKLEKQVGDLIAADRQNKKTIEEQAEDLEHTNEVLTAVRALFLDFIRRVNVAWTGGQAMPTLSAAELALLEHTTPKRKGRT